MSEEKTNEMLLDELRKLFPEIPKNCVYATITVQNGAAAMIRCGFVAKGETENKPFEVEFEIHAKRIID